MKNATLKSSTTEKTRTMLVELPIPTADALDLVKVRRQQREGRIVTKKQIVREVLEKYLADAE